MGPLPRSMSLPSRCQAFLLVGVSGFVLSALPARAASWDAIDALRGRLTSAGVRVIQQDCSRRGLQGLYHPRSDTLVVCRSHQTPAQVWDTLAHEATHRMQQCAGGLITDQRHHRAMAAALVRSHPAEIRSMRAYPQGQQLAELEARYTAKLPPKQVLELFDRYCGSQARI